MFSIKLVKSKILDVVDSNPNISALAESLYKLNHHQAIDFEIDAIMKISNFMPELYPHAPLHEKRKMQEIINIWILAKFCHYAENLAAYALSFLISYYDEKDEINGIFKYLTKYNMGQIIDFFTNIHKRDESYISKILGYPSPSLQTHDTNIILGKSCDTVKEILVNIARNYDEMYEFYTAYKHGYRIISGQANGSIDIITYIENDGSQRYFEVSKNDIQEIRTLSKQCSIILDCIFENHHERIRHETISGKSNVQIKTVMKGPSTYQKEELSILYPTRGESTKEDELEGDKVYAELFDNELESNNQGKIVAIDIDNMNIVSMDYDPNVVIESVHSRQSSGRIRIRRVGKNKSIGIKIW